MIKGIDTKVPYIGKLILNIRFGRWLPPEPFLINCFTILPLDPPYRLLFHLRQGLGGRSKSLFKISDQVFRVFEAHIKTDHFMFPVACIEIFR